MTADDFVTFYFYLLTRSADRQIVVTTNKKKQDFHGNILNFDFVQLRKGNTKKYNLQYLFL